MHVLLSEFRNILDIPKVCPKMNGGDACDSQSQH